MPYITQIIPYKARLRRQHLIKIQLAVLMRRFHKLYIFTLYTDTFSTPSHTDTMVYLPYQYTVISVICQYFATFDILPHHFSHETKIHICYDKFFHFLAYFYQNHGYFFRFKNFLYF